MKTAPDTNQRKRPPRHGTACRALSRLLGVALAVGSTQGATANPQAAAWIGDNPEPGKQGETMPGEAKLLPRPYSRGVRLVGHAAVPDGVAASMAWSGHCAYIPSGTGVNVIDVSDPAAPKVVGVLRDKGAVGAIETVSAQAGILAASRYGQHGVGSRASAADKDDAWLAVYDVSQCAEPRLILEYKWPQRVHTITVAPNGKRIYGPVLYAGEGKGGLQVLDISDRSNPRFLGRLGVTRSDGSTFEFAPHEVSVSPDERRIYAGVISSLGGDFNPGMTSFPSVETFGPDAGGLYILDNRDIAAGRPNPKMRLIGTSRRGGWHSAIQANIGGVPYLLGAAELGACPSSWPRISNMADEKNPRIVGEFRLEMNKAENCPAPTEAEIMSKKIVGRPGTAASHWNDVDDSKSTRLGLFPFSWAGLRIVDLRDPARPVEVAYFKPGDQCMTHVRHVRETGHIWFGCDSGFYVIDLQPALRASLELPPIGN